MSKEKYIDALASISLFKSLTREELAWIFNSSQLHIKDYNKNEVIYFQNEICNSMDVVLTGQVSVQKIDENGKILEISVLLPSEIMGASLMFSSKNRYPMTVIAKKSVVLLSIKKDLLLALCQENVSFLTGLIEVIADKTVTLTDKIHLISLKTIRECIISFLTYEYHIQKSTIIKLSLTKKEMAERFGVQRPSLSRELNKMRKEGLLEYDAKTITIKDLDILEC